MNIAVELIDLLLLKDDEPLINIPRLQIPAGEILGIMGHSNAGKSTLLKVLGLLAQPSQGTVKILGKEVDYSADDLLPLRRRMALVFQKPLFRDASVRDNLALGLQLRQLPKNTIRTKVDHWLRKLQISQLAHRHPRQLAPAEACRVSLAQALIVEPEILLLDGPMTALDGPSRALILDDLREILQESGITTIYATHDYRELSLLAHQGMLLYQGTVIQEGSVLELVNEPRSAVAASLVGVDNIIPGYISKAAEDEVEFNPANTAIRLYGTPRDSGLSEAFALIRSDEIELDIFPGPQWNAIEGLIVRVTPQGSTVKIHLDCGFPLVASLTHRKFRFKEYLPGQAITAVFDPAQTIIVRKLPK